MKAVESCLKCKLDVDFEIVVVDNGSIDDSATVINELLIKHNVNHQIFIFENNSGVGYGRNKGFELAKGDYVYFLDDDAEIDPKSYHDFFKLPIKIFRENPEIITISTRIFDEALSRYRIPMSIRQYKREYFKALMYQGGSHFIRSNFFQERRLYANIIYGYEELEPSLKIIKQRGINCYLHDVGIIHKPQFNKWISGSEYMKNNTINEFARIAAIKSNIYPKIFVPILILSMYLRWILHLKKFNIEFASCVSAYRKFKIEPIDLRLSTMDVLSLIYQFGIRSSF